MRGTCTQRHFPAVARPFRILWAPWAAAVFSFFTAIVASILFTAIFGTGFGGITLPLFILLGHIAAIVFGTKFQYLATIVTGMENRRTGGSNLSPKKGDTYDFSNL